MEFFLRTIRSKRPEVIRLRVASKDETERSRAAEKIKSGKDLLGKILTDRDPSEDDCQYAVQLRR